MMVSLTSPAEALIREKVETGLYRSADEAIAAAIRPLDDRDRHLRRLLAKLRVGLASGGD